MAKAAFERERRLEAKNRNCDNDKGNPVREECE